MGVSGKFSSAECSSWGYSRGCVPLGVGLGHPRCLLTSFSTGSLITQWLCPSAWQVDPRGTFPEKKPQCTSTDQASASSHVLLFHWPKQLTWPSPESMQKVPHEGLSQSNTTPPIFPKYVFISYSGDSNVLCRWVNLELINNMYWVLARGQMPWKLKVEALVASHVFLWDPIDCSPPDSSVHGILQAKILEWAAIPFSRGSSQPKDHLHCRQTLYHLSYHGSKCPGVTGNKILTSRTIYFIWEPTKICLWKDFIPIGVIYAHHKYITH